MSTPTAPSHTHYLRLALDLARRSPPRPTNFRVGACLVSPSTSPAPLVTGYTLECAGNTHAEQSCFIKLAEAWSIALPPTDDAEVGAARRSARELAARLPRDTVLYTTMEPCGRRSVGNTPCVDRILALRRGGEGEGEGEGEGQLAIRTVVVGVTEPPTFVGENTGREKLRAAGVEVVHVGGMEEEILEVAQAGHKSSTGT